MVALRPTGPRVERASSRQFHVLGLMEHSPLFNTREEAEAWLKAQLAKTPLEKRPKVRACMSCGNEFLSEGFHNRLCRSCKHATDMLGEPHRPFIARRT